MSCGCEHNPVTPCGRCVDKNRKPPVYKPQKGVVKFCDICDPCNKENEVRLCAFVVPTLEDGRYYRNSFVFVEEDDSTYFIDDTRSEIPFGSRPKFIDDFDPTLESIHYKKTVVYDVKNGVAYVYDAEGRRATVSLTATPITDITGGDGITVSGTGHKIISVDDTVAKAEDLRTVTYLVTNHTADIKALEQNVTNLGADVKDLDEKYTNTHNIADTAHELAVQARAEAASAQQGVTEALSLVADKQDKLTPGENIEITLDGVISSVNTTYSPFVGTDGDTTGQAGLVPAPQIADKDKYLNADGTWKKVDAVTQEYVDNLITYTTEDPGEGAPLEPGHLIAVIGE